MATTKKKPEGEMTLDRLADIIERTVAKKDDLKHLATKADLEAVREEMATKASLKAVESRLAEKIDDLKTDVENYKLAVERIEKHVGLTP